MWYLATITDGIDLAPWQTGHHCYVNRTVTGKVKVIGKAGATAILTLAEARKRVRVKFDKAGQPVKVRGQTKQDIKWQARESRRFDMAPQRILA